MEQKKKRTANRILKVAAGLLCLALLSAWALSGLLARFVTGTDGGEDANVAKFSITETDDVGTASVTLYPGIEQESNNSKFIVKVKNDSEVAVRFRFSMDLDGNLPVSVTPAAVSLKDAGNSVNLQPDTEDLTWYTLQPVNAGREQTYNFYAVWKDGEQYKSYRYSEGVENIHVTVTALQED